ncbi:hypothetical protein SH661x_002562 [Planctomicrobium sp. SH661]|uniref:hypothetical protein n=1 Tax=Planctomicrobium sp. SH661 TaxID=3448124 RepID=UPI003F5BAD72
MRYRHFSVVVFVLSTLFLAGCSGGDGLNRVEVRGKVTLDGEPLKDGSITFFPRGDGPVVGTRIENGDYHFPLNTGPVPGEYRVEINASAPNGKKITDFGGKLVDEYASIIPTKYNRKSTLTVNLQPAASGGHDFQLTSDPDKKK